MYSILDLILDPLVVRKIEVSNSMFTSSVVAIEGVILLYHVSASCYSAQMSPLDSICYIRLVVSRRDCLFDIIIMNLPVYCLALVYNSSASVVCIANTLALVQYIYILELISDQYSCIIYFILFINVG